MGTVPNDLQGIARRALEMVPEGAVIGLGTGRAATAFLRALEHPASSNLSLVSYAWSIVVHGLL